MTVSEFKNLTTPSQILDVRLEDDFKQCHLTGAKNNCVFEVSFTERLADTAPDKSLATIVYGANDDSLEAQMAAEKLSRLGYSEIHILEGGIEQAQADIPTEKSGDTPQQSLPDGNYQIDLEKSHIGWTGRNLLNKHSGKIGINRGQLNFDNGTLVDGLVEIDMNDIICDDLAGSDVHDILIAHLKDHDFFDVELHPTAEVRIKQVSNQQAVIDLTLKGITHEIEIPLVADFTEDGLPAAQSAFTIDRTRWGVLYGSKKLFNRLAGHLVSDWLEIDIRILTTR